MTKTPNDVKFPKKIRTEVRAFRPEEVYALLGCDAPQWVKDAIVIAFRTGMRPGEIFALKWGDINLDAGYISVQRAISRASSKAKETKTPSGTRRIDIDSKLTAYLMGMELRGLSEYVFPGTPQGKYKYRIPWNIAQIIKGMCREVGIPERNFYSLRHTHATVLMELGIHPKIVQERLGHSSIRITMDTYSHVSPTLQREAVNRFEEI
ncbi:site-specific integrase [Lachnoclostridium sp. An14]|uniref:site-specific integrase n=1 Tax=Lachnoclostridium sp. An14 TaxID=1965562 RepID=UPI0013A65201|nr:site-specific integrase [Lachnoclostridium sp. An14]